MNKTIKPYMLSETQRNLIDKLKKGWYLKQDRFTFMWVIIDEIKGTAIRINKNSINNLISVGALEKVTSKDKDFNRYVEYYDLYTLSKKGESL